MKTYAWMAMAFPLPSPGTRSLRGPPPGGRKPRNPGPLPSAGLLKAREYENLGSHFFDRLVCDIHHRPSAAGAQRSRVLEFGKDLPDVRIRELGGRLHLLQT